MPNTHDDLQWMTEGAASDDTDGDGVAERAPDELHYRVSQELPILDDMATPYHRDGFNAEHEGVRG